MGMVAYLHKLQTPITHTIIVGLTPTHSLDIGEIEHQLLCVSMLDFGEPCMF